jgi:hypothetical protein
MRNRHADTSLTDAAKWCPENLICLFLIIRLIVFFGIVVPDILVSFEIAIINEKQRCC